MSPRSSRNRASSGTSWPRVILRRRPSCVQALTAAAWYLMVRSYRQLNAAKWAVIGAFESRLPAYAYSRAEWAELGEGEDWRRYMPLTRLEQGVPPLFVAAYAVGFLALVL